MAQAQSFVTNLELRDSNPDGSEGAGLSHTAKGLFLLHVLEVAAEGEPRGGVAIVHGVGDHGGRYTQVAGFLAERGWAVALPDLRGHGNSEGERGHSWGIKEPVRDIDAVLDHLAYRLPDAPKVLVGQGLGGLYCLAYALVHPDRVAAVVAINPLLEPRFPEPKKPGGLKGLFKKLAPTDAGPLGIDPAQLSSDPAAQAAWKSDSLVHDLVSLHTAQRLPAEAQALREGLARLSVPVLLLIGEADTLSDPQQNQKLLSGKAEVKRYPGLKHDLLHERGATQIATEVAQWIAARA
jgi:alpha-beta hydrolase superfamily lysophospholipase